MDGSTATPSGRGPSARGPSPQLLEANRRLHELRTQAQAQRQAAGLQAGDAPPWETTTAADPAAAAKRADLELAERAGLELAERIAALPEHLGWESRPLTAVLRHANNDQGLTDPSWPALSGDVPSPVAVARPEETAAARLVATNNTRQLDANDQRASNINPEANDWVKLYPDIGLAMLRQEMSAPGRLWLMLRYLDQDGSGVLRIDNIEQQLTKKGLPLRLCGRRQLRNLLRAGNGVYWTRDKEHVWLRSAAKVAYTLGVERLTGRPVALPIAALLDGIGAFRAHLYAAFHSGRTKDTPYGEQAMPIARETLAGLSGVGRSSQRAYEEQAGVEVQANFAVGEAATEENQENRAWEQGQALFELKDYRGQQGKKGKTYLAWQLPNTYVGQHQKRPKGRQKRINRELNGLVTKGTPGNVGGMNETQRPEKIYYPNGKLAAQVYGRDPERELYWKRHRTGNGRFAVWQQLGGQQ